MKAVILTLITLMLAMCGGKNKVVQYEKATFISTEGHSLPYRILLPEGYTKNKNYPMLIFLHGSGERGNDNERQLTHIAPMFMEDNFRENYPAIVVFPQCAEEDTWSPIERDGDNWFVGQAQKTTPSMQALMELIDELILSYPIQRNRMYVAGLSMGGFGTYELLQKKPETFAAAIPICGGGDRRFVHEYQEVPFWIFHGAKDSVVPVNLSREMAENFQARGMDFEYTEYPEGEHDVWNTAWKEPTLIPWIFSQERMIRD